MIIRKAACGTQFFGSGELRGEIFRADAARPEAMLQKYAGQVQVVYMDPPFYTGGSFFYRPRKDGPESLAFSDRLSEEGYLDLLKSAAVSARELLCSGGSVYLHVDQRASAQARMTLDSVFGKSNFLNEIIWNYRSGGMATRYFSKKHDNIFFYSKTKKYYFDPYAVAEKRGNQKRNHMKESVDSSGRRFWSIKSSGREYRYYEDTPVLPTDVWTDIPHLQQKDPERTGYATQKPERLLERIILASSRPGDIIADLFAGSGTTGAVAAKLGRRFVLGDDCAVSMHVCRNRLMDAEGKIAVNSPLDDEGEPSFRVSVKLYGSGDIDVRLAGYLPHGGKTLISPPKQLRIDELELCDNKQYGPHAPEAQDLEHVEAVACGHMAGGVFYGAAHAVRPEAPLSLRIPYDADKNPAFIVTDVTARSYAFVLQTI